MMCVVCFASVLAMAVHDSHAQDMRRVTAPVVPPACATLLAGLSSREATLTEGDENKPDTQRIQQAIDGCRAGYAVRLEVDGGRNAFLSGPLQLRAGVTLLIAANTVLFGSRNPRDYDVSLGSCGILDQKGHGCKALINGDHTNNAGVMGDGTIDGRGWAKMQGQEMSWWDLAHEAKVKGSSQNCPRLIVLSHSDNFTLYRVTLRNAANYHVHYSNGDGFTAWGVTINTPKTARNTDGIDPASATNVTITHCMIHTGDDNVAIKAGAAGPSTHMTISHNHFYAGHGMSIGSETQGGVSAIRVTDLSIDGADNGLRIKSNAERGGLVQDIVYEDVCIRDTKNPILMDSHYPYSSGNRDKLPTFNGVVLRDVRVLGGGKITLEGYDAEHRLGITLDNVTVGALAAAKVSATHADVTLGPGSADFRPLGEDVKVTGNLARTNPNSCTGKFVPPPVH